MKKNGFTLMEFFIIMAIMVVLSAVVVLAINPSKMIVKSHDLQRNGDLTDLATALDLYLADNRDFKGLVGPYLSMTSGQKTDGTGWIPIKFNTISSGTPMSVLPFDPINNSTYHYTLGINPVAKTYEIDCAFELQGNIAKEATDGGNNVNAYEIGTDLTILP